MNTTMTPVLTAMSILLALSFLPGCTLTVIHVFPEEGVEKELTSRSVIPPSASSREEAKEALATAQARYGKAQDRLQEFEEKHFVFLQGEGKTAFEVEYGEKRKQLEDITENIRGLRSTVKMLELAHASLDREIVMHERTANPEHAVLQKEVIQLKAELDALLGERQADHPAVVQKTELYKKRNAILVKTRPFLKDVETRHPNPRWEESSRALKKARAELAYVEVSKLELSEKLEECREKIKQIPMIRGQHRRLLDQVDLASEEVRAAARRNREAHR